MSCCSLDVGIASETPRSHHTCTRLTCTKDAFVTDKNSSTTNCCPYYYKAASPDFSNPMIKDPRISWLDAILHRTSTVVAAGDDGTPSLRFGAHLPSKTACAAEERHIKRERTAPIRERVQSSLRRWIRRPVWVLWQTGSKSWIFSTEGSLLLLGGAATNIIPTPRSTSAEGTP